MISWGDKMLNDISELSYENKEKIPSIPLYMDQLLMFIDEYFKEFKRNDKEKILTKTMVNNYVKAKLVEAPHKKKYEKQQIKKLMMVYKMKNILSINDTKKYFSINEGIDIDKMFEDFIKCDEETLKHINLVGTKEEKKDMIFKLVIEADIKKRIAEMLLDSI